jgi:hypothetical protein
LPKKEYKKAVKRDQEKTIPIMNQDEYTEIINELKIRATLKGKASRIVNSRKSEVVLQPRIWLVLQPNAARVLIPVIHFMATYGLRIGAIHTIKLS